MKNARMMGFLAFLVILSAQGSLAAEKASAKKSQKAHSQRQAQSDVPVPMDLNEAMNKPPYDLFGDDGDARLDRRPAFSEIVDKPPYNLFEDGSSKSAPQQRASASGAGR